LGPGFNSIQFIFYRPKSETEMDKRKKTEITLSGENKGRNHQESNRGVPLSPHAIDVMCTDEQLQYI